MPLLAEQAQGEAVSEQRSAEAEVAAEGAGVAYPLEARPRPVVTALLGLQHVLAMFVGIVTPPLILAGHLKLDLQETSFLVSMALIASGLTTFLQIRRWGPVGSGLLGVQGTSFTFLKPALHAASVGGLPLVLGMAIITAPLEMVMSRFVRLSRRLFPPVVMGTVVTLIGLELVRVGITDLGGGHGAPDFGHPRHLLLGLLVLAVVVLVSRWGRGLLQVSAVAIGLAVGYAVAAALGMVDFGGLDQVGWVTVPRPLKYGLAFDVKLVLPWLVAYLVTTIETMGDLTASAQNSGERVDTPLHTRRLAGGVLADALGSVLAGLLNTLPNTTFSQNNGVILITRAGARVIGYAAGAILLVLGLFPKVGGLLGVMPPAVLGGATVAMFGLVAVSGLKIIASAGFTERNLFILAISLGLGLGVSIVPEVVGKLPELLQGVLSSGMAVGALTATTLHLVIPADRKPPPSDAAKE